MPARREWELRPDVLLEPLAYPGRVFDCAGLVRYCRFTQMTFQRGRGAGRARVWSRAVGEFERLDDVLRAESVPVVQARTLVVGVGSNAAPDVLHGKFLRGGASVVVPIAPCRVTNLGVGHSAHVSRRGYIAAAPFAMPGNSRIVHVSWLDADQLRVLDATEPNYVRMKLGGARFPLEVVDSGERPSAYHLYVSRWGVLAQDGVPITLGTQAELHACLARSSSVFDVRDPERTVARLASRQVQDQLRAEWVAQGRALPHGIAPAGDPAH